MLKRDLKIKAMKRYIAAEPFIDYDAQRVLVTSRTRFPFELLRCHIGYRTSPILKVYGISALGNNSETKIAQQDFIIGSQQHILGLDIAVDQLFIMRIL